MLPPFLHLTSLFLFSFPFHTLLPIPASSHSHPSCLTLGDSFVCPPSLSYPSSASPGCGHPSFQIHCSSNNSIISINNSNFSIISHKSYSLNISLFHCNSSLPIHPINLSSTPFRISNTTCFKLPLPPNNKSHCNPTTEWQKRFPGSPHNLRSGCNDINLKQNSSVCLILLEWDRTSNFFSSFDKCEKLKHGFCAYNDSEPEKRFICFEPNKSSRNHIALKTVILAIACFSLVSALAVTIFGRRWRSKAGEEDPTAVFLHRHRSSHLLPPVFTYEELDSATNRFDPNRKIGDGGFGSVYLAQLSDGQIVAVKRLHRRHAAAAAASSKSFCNEILILSSISHPSLVRLHGYCSDPRGLILVYDYVPNGTLADHLHGSKSHSRRASLTWRVRVDVALQTAMAIEYLHFAVAPAVVHRDITSSNIFVERDMRVKLGDFGLSRLLVFTEPSATHVWTGPQGTPGYLDPEYHRSFRLTEKSDVYSFGVVLFELISGMKAVDLRREKREVALADLVVGKIQVGELRQVVDPVLEGEEAMGTVDAVAELAFRCVAVDKDDRPDAREVVAELRRIRSRLRGQTP
ncbi:hypothetical protein AAC387_Pa03g3750 [Persea americana]